MSIELKQSKLLVEELKKLNDSLTTPDTKTKAVRLVLKGQDAILFELRLLNQKVSQFKAINGVLSGLFEKLDRLPVLEKYLAEIAKKEAAIRGERGLPGIDADENRIIRRIMSVIPIPRDGKDCNEKQVVEDVLKKIKVPKDGKDCDEQIVIREVLRKIPIPKNGRPPKHEIKEHSIRFENPDGTWGEWIHFGDYMLGGQKTVHRGGTKYARYDVSSQCNGVNKVFVLPDSYESNSVMVYGTQFPLIYRPAIDFTESGDKQVTLTDEVGAPASDQTVIITYVKN